MPNYQWKGRTRAGDEQSGVLVADSKDAVMNMLRAKQIQVTAVTEKGKEFSLPKVTDEMPDILAKARQIYDAAPNAAKR